MKARALVAWDVRRIRVDRGNLKTRQLIFSIESPVRWMFIYPSCSFSRPKEQRRPSLCPKVASRRAHVARRNSTAHTRVSHVDSIICLMKNPVEIAQGQKQ